MSLDLDIQALLLSPQVREINFSMRGIRVTGMGFAELATCFSDHAIAHRIRVTTNPAIVGGRADAAYQPQTDQINLRADTVLQNVIGRSQVVHECTHAQLDLRRLSTPILSEESAAFIAEAWYLLACGVSHDEIDRRIDGNIRAIALILRMQSQITGGIVEVTADQINQARSVMGSFGYGRGHYRSDGIGGHVYRGD